MQFSWSALILLCGFFWTLLSGREVLAGEEERQLAICLEESCQRQKPKSMGLREKSLEQAARVYGFQRGFAWRYTKLYAALQARSQEFAKIFDFRRLLLPGRILPPVIRWSGPATRIISDTQASHVEAEYRIVAKARFVAEAPGLESYFRVDCAVLEPESVLLPRDAGERSLWQKALTRGWHEGSAHALTVFDQNMAKIVGDFRGILQFLRLQNMGLVSLPVLEQNQPTIQVKDEVLALDAQSFRIRLPARFCEARGE
ncbi:MAG: type IV secretory system conjugative DNA transfer family protein [Desulfovibrio sp.]|nr:type IV secretory system conjugative DNA transfer family protein [Desulfovibrio sp.]